MCIRDSFYTDVKLAVGYTSVLISAACFAFDYKLGFAETKYWTAAAVAIYFILNGIYTYWLMYVEKDVVFTGSWNGRQLVVSTNIKKNDPTYRLTARYSSTTSSNELSEVSIEAPFMQWFTADGYFVAKPFQQWLASSVPLISEVDPKNKTATTTPGLAQEPIARLQSTGAVLYSMAPGTQTAGSNRRRKG